MAPPSRGRRGASTRRATLRNQKDPELVELGQLVRRRRREAGLTQQALAARSGLHPATIGHVEQGTQNSGLVNLVKLARGLDLSAAELVTVRASDARPGAS